MDNYGICCANDFYIIIIKDYPIIVNCQFSIVNYKQL